MSDDRVKALWVGPGPRELPDKTILVPGESTYLVPRAQAEASDYWQIVEPAPEAKATKSTKATTTGADG